jgi:hypothetical protein
MFGGPIGEWCKPEEKDEQRQKFVDGTKALGDLLDLEPGPFFAGTQPCAGDFELVAYLAWFKLGAFLLCCSSLSSLCAVVPDVYGEIMQSPQLQRLWQAVEPYM